MVKYAHIHQQLYNDSIFLTSGEAFFLSNNIVSNFFSPVTCPQQVRVIRWQKAGGSPRCNTVKRSAS